MKRWTVLLLLFCLSGSALAQTEPARDKDLGILFSFNGLSDLSLGNYENGSGCYGLGVKMFKKNTAVRTMLVFNTNSTSYEPSSTDTNYVDYVGGKTSSSTWGVSADYLLHANASRISPFIGTGLGFITQLSKAESSHQEASKANISEDKQSRFFVKGILGVEIFLKKNISLSGEYTLQYMRTSRTRKATPAESSVSSEVKENASSFSLAAAGSLTLSIYFAKSSE